MKEKCSSCGMTWAQFLQTKRLGCAGCYADFEEKLLRIWSKRDFQVPYPGDAPPNPDNSGKPEDLDLALKQALAREDYEEAARIRDFIKKRGQS